MKLRILPVFFAALIGLCASANAARVYYLVGLRHVYSVPVLPDPYELDRQAIEENYASAVAGAQKQFDTDMASIHDEEAKDGGNIHQVDRDAVQQNLEAEITSAAEKRDADLADLYPQMDSVRASHPEFKVDQDGPYHVIGVDTAPTGEYVNVVYYRPYPLYVEPCPFGWGWGQPYPYATFGIQIGLFHSTWISIGAPVFEPMYYGDSVFICTAPVRETVIISRQGWAGGRPPVITMQDRLVLQQRQAALTKSGYYNRPGAGVPARSLHVSKYSRTSTSIGSRYGRTAASGATPGRGTAGSTTGAGVPNRYSRTQGSTIGSSTVSKYSRTPSAPPTSGSPSKAGSDSGKKKDGH